jgi:hypothetical protein
MGRTGKGPTACQRAARSAHRAQRRGVSASKTRTHFFFEVFSGVSRRPVVTCEPSVQMFLSLRDSYGYACAWFGRKEAVRCLGEKSGAAVWPFLRKNWPGGRVCTALIFATLNGERAMFPWKASRSSRAPWKSPPPPSSPTSRPLARRRRRPSRARD